MQPGTPHLVPLKGANRLIGTQFAHVNETISGTRGEARVVLPIHVQGGLFMEAELLLHLPRADVPHHCGFVHTPCHDEVPFAVPLEGEDWAGVVGQRGLEGAVHGP